jgi:hypothetical protein
MFIEEAFNHTKEYIQLQNKIGDAFENYKTISGSRPLCLDLYNSVIKGPQYLASLSL